MPNITDLDTVADTDMSDALNSNTQSLLGTIEDDAQIIIRNALLYEEAFSSLNIEEFIELSGGSTTKSDLNDYTVDLQSLLGINSVSAFHVRNDTDDKEMYVLGDLGGSSRFYRLDFDYSSGVTGFETLVTVSNTDLPNGNATYAWLSNDGTLCIASFEERIDAIDNPSVEFYVYASAYDSDGNVLVSDSRRVYVDTPSDSRDDVNVSFYNTGGQTAAETNSSGSVCGFFFETNFENDSTDNEDADIRDGQIVYNDSNQTFSFPSTELDDINSEENAGYRDAGRYQAGTELIQYIVKDFRDPGDELEAFLVATTDLVNNTTSLNTIASGRDDDAGGFPNTRHQDYIKGEVYDIQRGSTDYWQFEYYLVKNNSQIFSDNPNFQEGRDTRWDNFFPMRDGVVWTQKEDEDEGNDTFFVKKYFDRDGSSPNINLTPQYSLERQDYWFDDGTRRYGFNLNGTDLRLDWLAETEIEYVFTNTVSAGTAVVLGSTALDSFVKQNVVDDLSISLEQGEGTSWFYDETTNNVTVKVRYSGGVLDSTRLKFAFLTP